LFGYAGFGDSQAPYTTVGQNNGRFQLGWCMRRGKAPLGNSQGEVSPGYFELANAVHGDFNVRDEMIAQTVADKFWLIFSSNIPVSPNYFGETCVDVRFGVSDIEIWVK
jgi:hypothetical protein